MAQLIIAQNGSIASVTYKLPNKHYFAVDMGYLGVDNLSVCVSIGCVFLFSCSFSSMCMSRVSIRAVLPVLHILDAGVHLVAGTGTIRILSRECWVDQNFCSGTYAFCELSLVVTLV